jgi:hypothetical protein
MMKWIQRWAALAVAGLALSLALPAQERTENIEKSFRTEGSRPAVLEFHDVDGRLLLSPSADGSISVHVRKEVKVRDAKRAERLLRDTKVEIDQRGNTVTVRVRYPRFRGLFFWLSDSSRVKVTSEISVPTGARVRADLVDGSIRGENLQADMDLGVVDGDIWLGGLKGSIKAGSVDGAISVQGEIKDLDVKAVDGDVRIDLSSASIMGRDWSIRTTDGDVDLVLPAGFSAEMKIQTGDGRIQSEWPLTADKTGSRKKVSGRIGAGGPVFSVRTVDGHVTLKKK